MSPTAAAAEVSVNHPRRDGRRHAVHPGERARVQKVHRRAQRPTGGRAHRRERVLPKVAAARLFLLDDDGVRRVAPFPPRPESRAPSRSEARGTAIASPPCGTCSPVTTCTARVTPGPSRRFVCTPPPSSPRSSVRVCSATDFDDGIDRSTSRRGVPRRRRRRRVAAPTARSRRGGVPARSPRRARRRRARGRTRTPRG